MRFLIPIVVLLVASVLMPREPQEPTAKKEVVQQAYPDPAAGTAATADVATDYDEVIESSGMLNRLELLEF